MKRIVITTAAICSLVLCLRAEPFKFQGSTTDRDTSIPWIGLDSAKSRAVMHYNFKPDPTILHVSDTNWIRGVEIGGNVLTITSLVQKWKRWKSIDSLPAPKRAAILNYIDSTLSH